MDDNLEIPEPEYIDGDVSDVDDSPTVEHDQVEEFLRIGPLIRSYRRLAGWSQSDLSGFSDVEEKMIVRIEGGKTRRPHNDTLSRLAQAFARRLGNVSPEELLQDFIDAKDLKTNRMEADPEAKLITARLRIHSAKFKRRAYETFNMVLDALESAAEHGQ